MWSAYRKFLKEIRHRHSDEEDLSGGDSLLTVKKEYGSEEMILILIRKSESGSYQIGNKQLSFSIVITRIIESAPLSFEEVRGEVIADYQEFLEKE